MKLTWQVHPVKLKTPFRISKGLVTERQTLLIKLEAEGKYGLGEASVIDYYGFTIQKHEQALERAKIELQQLTFETPKILWQCLQPLFRNNRFVLSAIDCAAHDLYAKWLKKPLYEVLNSPISNAPFSSISVGIGSKEEVVKRAAQYNWPYLKLKLGSENDIEVLKYLRKTDNRPVRVDANGGWTLSEAIEKVKAMEALKVELVEQPLPADQWEEMEELKAVSPLPLIADESFQTEQDLEKCYQYFDGINIKLMKCGGITPALDIIQRARLLGMPIMAGCMTETSIGISALAHICPFFDYLDMDGAALIANDPAFGVKVVDGRVVFRKAIGVGGEMI